MHFVTRAVPIDDIDGKSHKTELKSNHNHSTKLKIMPLVIYGLASTHTQTHIHDHIKAISRNQACHAQAACLV